MSFKSYVRDQVKLWKTIQGNVGGGSGRQSKTVSGLPYGLGPMLTQAPGGVRNSMMGGLLNPQMRGQSLQSFMLDPSQFQAAGNQLGATMSGQYLDPSQTPAGQGMISAVTGNQQRQLAQQDADLRSRFAKSGQNLSGPLMNAQYQAGSTAAQQTARDILQQLFASYNQERSNQLAATQNMQNYQLTPYNLFSGLSNAFKSQVQSQPTATTGGQYLNAGINASLQNPGALSGLLGGAVGGLGSMLGLIGL